MNLIFLITSLVLWISCTTTNDVYITSISRAAKDDPSLTATDGLHPSGKMYGFWVEAIFPVAKNILSGR